MRTVFASLVLMIVSLVSTLCLHAQTEPIAKIVVHVTPTGAAAEGETAARLEKLNGQPLVQLTKEHDGKTVAVVSGSYIFLRFESVYGPFSLEVSPPSALETPSGTLFLPRGVIYMLKANNSVTATITVKGNLLRDRGKIISKTIMDPNWSGYAITNGPFASVTGEWNVPTIKGDGGDPSYSGTWIGIDGFAHTDPNIIQIGTIQNWSSGVATYAAFWEILPNPPAIFPNPVQPGDHMRASVSVNAASPTPGQTQTWSLIIADDTQGWSNGVQETYAAALSSAEWVEEAPTVCAVIICGVAPLADYGLVSFDGRDFANSRPPQLTAAEAISMNPAGKVISSPSSPDGDLDGFSLAFGATSPVPPGPLITTTTLPSATLLKPYTFQLQATESGNPATFQWAGANLPSWLSLGQTTGTLAGTPRSGGNFSFSVTARDTNNPWEVSQTQQLRLNVKQSGGGTIAILTFMGLCLFVVIVSALGRRNV